MKYTGFVVCEAARTFCRPEYLSGGNIGNMVLQWIITVTIVDCEAAKPQEEINLERGNRRIESTINTTMNFS